MALVAVNVFAVVRAAMEAAKRANANQRIADMPLSEFALIHAARSVHDGMDLMLDEDTWKPIHAMTPYAFAKRLVE